MSSPNLKTLLHNVNEQLAATVTWLYKNKLCVNHNKSKYTTVQPNNKKDKGSSDQNKPLLVQDLEQVDSYNTLA